MATSSRVATMGAVLALATFSGAGLVTPAPARADVKTYLQTLHNAGINRDETEELEMGWEVCALRELGVDPEHVQDQAVQNSRTYPPDGITLAEAGQIVRIAIDELCNKRLSPKPVSPTGNRWGRSEVNPVLASAFTISPLESRTAGA